VTGRYTYPAPSEYADGDGLISGYYHTGEMVDLIDSDPPSPTQPEHEAIPQLAAGHSEGDRGPVLQLNGATFTPEAPLPMNLTQATSTNSPAQLPSIYSQALPYASSYAARQDQDQYPLPPRSITSHTATATHDLPAAYSSYATGPVLASLPSAGSRDALPPAEQDRRPLPQRQTVPHTGTATQKLPAAYNSYATGPLPASVAAASSQDTQPPVNQNQNRHPLPPRWTAQHAGTVTNPLPATHGNGYATGSLLASLPNANTKVAQAPMVQPTSFTGPLQHYNYPYRTNNTPIPWVPPPTLTLPNGSMVGQPIPYDLQSAIDAIRRLPIVGSTGHPQRSVLKRPFDGSYNFATRDAQLIRDHFASGSGLLKVDSPLRHWYGDLRVFEARMWEFLVVQKARR
jgi:hypothetical protein